jgi:uncharacterized protein (TIGR02145 family)
LFKYIGGTNVAGFMLKAKNWNFEKISKYKLALTQNPEKFSPIQKLAIEEEIYKLQKLDGEDKFGFSVLPFGYNDEGTIEYSGEQSVFRTATLDYSSAIAISIEYDRNSVIFSNFGKRSSMKISVRCIKCDENEQSK